MRAVLTFILLLTAPTCSYADSVFISRVATSVGPTYLTINGNFNPTRSVYDPWTIGGFAMQIYLGPGHGYSEGDFIVRFVEAIFNDGAIPIRQNQANGIIPPSEFFHSGGWGPQVGFIPESLFAIGNGKFDVQIPLSLIPGNPSDFEINLYDTVAGGWYNGTTQAGGYIAYDGVLGGTYDYPPPDLVPETDPLILLGIGVVGLVACGRRFKRPDADGRCEMSQQGCAPTH